MTLNPPARPVVILGYDAVSPLGTEFDTQWRRLLAGRSGIGPLTRFDPPPDFPVSVAGQVADIDTAPYPFLSPRSLALWPSPIFKYAMLVVHRALEKSGITITPDLAPRVAVTFSSAVGGQDAVLHADRRLLKEGKLPPPYANPNSCINMVSGKISMLTGATGPIMSTITACATGVTSIITGSMLIQSGQADVAICGAVDFPLVEPIVAGFATMNAAYQARAESTEPPQRASRPFSLGRRGFVISEGAGAVILASAEFARVQGLDPRIAVAGWGMTADAAHYVAPRLATVISCMAAAIDRAGISAHDVRFVNAHAASTKVGDRVEFQALEAIFGKHLPPVSANKSMLGHAMGAASALESVFTLKGMQAGRIPPTINYHPDPQLDPQSRLDCVPAGWRRQDQEFVLKNAFGFGGCNAALVFQRMA